jgi:hypothetical protein
MPSSGWTESCSAATLVESVPSAHRLGVLGDQRQHAQRADDVAGDGDGLVDGRPTSRAS